SPCAAARAAPRHSPGPGTVANADAAPALRRIGRLNKLSGLTRLERNFMEYRQLGRSGLRVSTLTLGTMTFGGRGKFRADGATDVVAARPHLDPCLDAGGS